MTTHNDDILLNERAAADVLGGVSVKTLQRWRYRGQGPGWLKVGASVFYRKGKLQDWLKSRERDPEAAA